MTTLPPNVSVSDLFGKCFVSFEGSVDAGSLRAKLVSALPTPRPLPLRTAGVVAALAIAAGAWFMTSGSGRAGSGPPETELARATTTIAAPQAAPSGPTPGGIVVQVAGAVNSPGVYDLAQNARVSDAIDSAGGISNDGDLDRLNLAAKLTDGERLYVLRKGQQSPPAVAGPTSESGGASAPGDSSEGSPVDLNSANETALDKLPGVGPATAKAIVDYRKSHGPFGAVTDLSKVKGIGPSKLDQIRPLVRV